MHIVPFRVNDSEKEPLETHPEWVDRSFFSFNEVNGCLNGVRDAEFKLEGRVKDPCFPQRDAIYWMWRNTVAAEKNKGWTPPPPTHKVLKAATAFVPQKQRQERERSRRANWLTWKFLYFTEIPTCSWKVHGDDKNVEKMWEFQINYEKLIFFFYLGKSHNSDYLEVSKPYFLWGPSINYLYTHPQ